MTRSERLSALSNTDTQGVSKTYPVEHDKWIGHSASKLATIDEGSWLADTVYFAALLPKHEFLVNAEKRQSPAPLNWTSLFVKHLLDHSNDDFNKFSNFGGGFWYWPGDDPHRSIDQCINLRSDERSRFSYLFPRNEGWLVVSPGAHSSTASPTTAHFAVVTGHGCQDLNDALHDLDDACVEANEEEFPIPSDTAVKNARWLLPRMYAILPRRFEVYPTPDGEIAIDVPGGPDHSALILLDSDGGAQYFGYFDGKQHFEQLSDAGNITDDFLQTVLATMERNDCTAL